MKLLGARGRPVPGLRRRHVGLVAMKLTGHKTESVYRRYAIVAKADLTKGVSKLAKLHELLEAESRGIAQVRHK